MSGDQSQPPSATSSPQREVARRSLLRANSAVALALLAVMSLAAIATVASLRARRSLAKAEMSEEAARAELWRAYLSDIRALRQDKTLGRRPQAVDVIRRATEIAVSPELRNEAVATLALPDFHLESSFPADPAIVATAFDSALRWCAFSLTNGAILIRSNGDQRELARLEMAEGKIPANQEGPSLLEFSPDGRYLSARYRRGALVVWEWEQKRTVFRHDIDKARRLASRGRFSADGRHLVGPVFGPKDGMGVFELESGKLVAHFPQASSFHHVAVRPGSPMFAAYNGTDILLLDWEKQIEVSRFPFEAGVRTMAWSPDGSRLAIAGNLLEVHIWNVDSRQRQVLSGHKQDVSGVVFDTGGNRIATASLDGVSRLWDLRDGRLIGLTTGGRITRWESGDRLVFEASGRGIEVRQLTPSPVYRNLTGPANASSGRTMDISADGDWAVSGAGQHELQFWNLSGGDRPEIIPMQWLRSLSFHPAEPKLFITKRGGPDEHQLGIDINGTGPKPVLKAPLPMRSVGDRNVDLVASSADGRRLAWIDLRAGRIWVEDVNSTANPVLIKNSLHNSLADSSSSVRGSGTISLSPDGRWLACGVSEGGVSVFDTGTGEFAHRLTEREAGVQFSPDGRWLVAAEKARCWVFRVSDWAQVWQSEHQRSEHPAAAFSPDGSMLATVNSSTSAGLFDVVTGQMLAELQSPNPAPIVSMRWSADGRRLVCATRENCIEVWRPQDLRRELTALGLGWDSKTPAPPVPNPKSSASEMLLPIAIFATAGLISLLALLALRRHHRLVESFTRTEALAAQRERELVGEREIRQLKDSFVSMVSHEFRTPLGIIQSSAQILDRYLDRLPDEQRREQLVSITKNVRRMASLIDEVLVLGKAEGGQLRCLPAPIQLASFCEKLADEMRSATNGACPIRLEISDLPAALADEALLRHILGNLISNAVKYSPQGRPVEVQIRRESFDAILTVRDEGLGIPAADQPKLFTAFHRGTNVGQISGTGLGLTIVKRCVELHGGTISFTTAAGKGTTFTVRLPLFPEPSNPNLTLTQS